MEELVCRSVDLTIRLMRDEPAEYELIARWLNAPHVKEWWDPDDPPATVDSVATKYHPQIMEHEGTTPCVIEFQAQPCGYIQFYRWIEDVEEAREMGFEPDEFWWGVDMFIGEANLISQGLGSSTVRLVSEYLCRVRGAQPVALTVNVENERAERAYIRAGFRREKQVLDTDIKDGRRCLSWLMLFDCLIHVVDEV